MSQWLVSHRTFFFPSKGCRWVPSGVQGMIHCREFVSPLFPSFGDGGNELQADPPLCLSHGAFLGLLECGIFPQSVRLNFLILGRFHLAEFGGIVCSNKCKFFCFGQLTWAASQWLVTILHLLLISLLLSGVSSFFSSGDLFRQQFNC